ncbi:MAG: protein arginine kinase [Calditrichaeota bacterium]|nr:MAG: protein arginine kinase [Calditrichota bacterium]
MRKALKKDSKSLVRQQQAQQFIQYLLNGIPSWAAGSREINDILLSTRIRLARNLMKIPFPSTATDGELKQVMKEVEKACQQAPLFSEASYLYLQDLDEIHRKVLVERRLISPAFAEADHPGMVIIDAGESISIMVNEEDHLRIQSIQPGLGLREAWRVISRVDDELSEKLNYAFSEQFGYLTACPTNTGTGMRASILVHLPALSIMDEVEKVIHDLAPSEIAVRGFYGEGTEVIGNIFQVSNQLTLGRTESAIVDRLEIVAHKFIELEQAARERLFHERQTELEDKVFRALAILQNARIMSSLEFMNHLSMIRLGADLELIRGLDSAIISELMIFTQPAHMQMLHKELHDAGSRDVIRAQIIRKKMSLK